MRLPVQGNWNIWDKSDTLKHENEYLLCNINTFRTIHFRLKYTLVVRNSKHLVVEVYCCAKALKLRAEVSLDIGYSLKCSTQSNYFFFTLWLQIKHDYVYPDFITFDLIKHEGQGIKRQSLLARYVCNIFIDARLHCSVMWYSLLSTWIKGLRNTRIILEIEKAVKTSWCGESLFFYICLPPIPNFRLIYRYSTVSFISAV